MRKIQLLSQHALKQNDPIHFLARLFMYQKTSYDRAIYYAAMILVCPEATPEIPSQLQDGDRVRDLAYKFLNKPEEISANGDVTNYDIVPMSDSARKETRIYREQNGYIHVGERYQKHKNKQKLHLLSLDTDKGIFRF